MQSMNGEKKISDDFLLMDDRYRSSAPVCKVDKQCVKNEKKVEKRIKMLQSRREGSIRLLFLNKEKKEKRKKKHRNEKEKEISSIKPGNTWKNKCESPVWTTSDDVKNRKAEYYYITWTYLLRYMADCQRNK